MWVFNGENKENPESREGDEDEENYDDDEETIDSSFTPIPSFSLFSILAESLIQDLVIANTSTSSSGNFIESPNHNTGKLRVRVQYKLFLLESF